jgi:hypothetical protein
MEMAILNIKWKHRIGLQKKQENKRKSLLEETQGPAAEDTLGPEVVEPQYLSLNGKVRLELHRQAGQKTVSGRYITSSVQVVDSLSKVSVTDSGHLETGVAAEHLGRLTECVRHNTDILSEGEAIRLLQETFLSEGTPYNTNACLGSRNL